MAFNLTRRQSLTGAAFLGAASALGLSSASPPPPLFEEIPPASSGVEWVHDNAMSDIRFLPETLGPGCAFLDHCLKNNGGSYLSSHDPRQVLGLGDATKIDELEIQWAAPSKRIEKLTNLEVNRYIHIIEGKGIV